MWWAALGLREEMKMSDQGRLAHLLLKFGPHAIVLLDAQSKRLGSFLGLELRLVREERRKRRGRRVTLEDGGLSWRGGRRG